jgi:hypothetical protein
MKRNRAHRRRLAVLLLCGMPCSLCAQSGAYLIPRTIYVGDTGTLVYPLPASFPLPQSGAEIRYDTPSSALVINAVTLEAEQRRLLIDFQAWAPGTVSLPGITIGGEKLEGLTITVSSILDRDSGSARTLAPPASALTAPGTFWLIFAAVFALILVCLALILGALYGRRWYAGLRVWLRGKRARRSLRRTERRLRGLLATDCPDCSRVLGAAQAEFRLFLGVVGGIDCRAFAAGEFQVFGVPALTALFSAAEQLRFGGTPPDRAATAAFLDELERLAQELEQRGAPA